MTRSLWRSAAASVRLDITVPLHLAYCGIASTLRHYAPSTGSHLAVLKVWDEDCIDSYVQASRVYLDQFRDHRADPEPYVQSISSNTKDKRLALGIYRRAAENGKGIIVCSNFDEVDEEIKLFADIVREVPAPTRRQINATFRRFGHSLTDADEDMIAHESWTRLIYAFPPDRPLLAGLRRLRDTHKQLPATVPAIDDGPSLNDLSGFDEVRDWGLELAQDLARFQNGEITWDEVDRGVLISGPPGVGKTFFAKALARSCNVPIVATSPARWQATGNLSELLVAMRKSFQEAATHPAAILFIDEIDSIGSRARTHDHNADYMRQVINGLLELLDGFHRRRGVVVVGATNHPEHIDPAILRAGRLDRHLVIPPLDNLSREKIFEFHAGYSVPDEYKQSFYLATQGMSGAEIEQLVRDAKRLARRKGKCFDYRDVEAAGRQLVQLPMEQVRVAAIHEAGHAIVGLEVGMELEAIAIADTIAANGRAILGGARFSQQPFRVKTRSVYLDHLAMYLGGLAAEELIFGEFSDGGAAGHDSDLGRATALATQLEACFGMGKTLAVELASERDLRSLRERNFSLSQTVNDLLTEQFERSKTMLKDRLDALICIADILVKKRSMDNAEVVKALALHARSRCEAVGTPDNFPNG